jgi:hypothetical protein
MGLYNRGDKVRIIDKNSILYNQMGTVVSSNRENLIEFGSGFRRMFHNSEIMLESDFQKIDRHNPLNPFKIGDEVRNMRRGKNYLSLGKVYLVDGDSCSVFYDGGIKDIYNYTELRPKSYVLGEDVKPIKEISKKRRLLLG